MDCKLLKKDRVKVTLSFVFSAVPTTRPHGGGIRNEQVPLSWLMTRKKQNSARKLVRQWKRREGINAPKLKRVQGSARSKSLTPPFLLPQGSPSLGGEGSCLGQLSMRGFLWDTDPISFWGEGSKPASHISAKQKRTGG